MTTAPTRDAGAPPRPARRLDELDGLRGVAVLLVLGFHVAGTLLPGGFIGVDVFFVLSGFLITGILVAQLERGGIDFRRFYVRRARRLLPALLMVSAAVVAYVLLLGPTGDSPEQADRTVLGALTGLGYVSNLVLASEGAGAIGLMGHTWSLSVEEHFYLLWPVVLLGLATVARSRRALTLAVAGLLGLSVALPHLLLAGGASTERIYYATDTRAWFLLAGCLLALLLGDDRLRAHCLALLRPGLAVAGLVVLVAATLVLERTGQAYYRGGAVLVVLSAVALIGAVVLRPASGVAGLLRARPLVALGAWSYGLYLWHYPLFLVAYDLVGSETELQRTLARAGAALVAVPVAWASFRWVEHPIVVRGWRALRPGALATQ